MKSLDSNEIKWNLDRREGLDCSRPPWKWPQSMIYSSSDFLTQTVKHLRDNSKLLNIVELQWARAEWGESKLKSSYWNVVDWIVVDWILADSPTICMIDLFGFVNRSNALQCFPLLGKFLCIDWSRVFLNSNIFRKIIEDQWSKLKEDRNSKIEIQRRSKDDRHRSLSLNFACFEFLEHLLRQSAPVEICRRISSK